MNPFRVYYKQYWKSRNAFDVDKIKYERGRTARTWKQIDFKNQKA